MRLVERALELMPMDHRKFVLPYLDDILIHTRTIAEHLAVLASVLNIHRQAGMKISPQKTFLLRREVEYLGHLVSS